MLSKKKKSSNLFKFGLHKNLITANSNSQGKSTLVKVLLWTFGCEPLLDEEWTEQGCVSLVNFKIGDIEHQILRDGSNIFYKGVDDLKRFHKITDAYSKFFASLVDFKVLLPARKANDDEAINLQTPPPSYYFLPYYIDQDRGWNDTWEDFQNLQQYQAWKKTVVQAHTGYLTSEYFELSKRIANTKDEELVATRKLDKINTTLSVIDEYLPAHNFTIEPSKFGVIEKEVRVELNNLMKNQESLLLKLSSLQSDHHYLNSQYSIAFEAIKEIEADYIFATEYIEDNFECPTCGVMHNNSILNRLSILDDKSLAENHAKELLGKIESIKSEIIVVQEQLDKMELSISEINQKYKFDDANNGLGLSDYVDGLASNSIQSRVADVQVAKRSEIKVKQDKLKELTKEQKKLSAKNKKDLDERFQKELYDIKIKLKVDDLETSKIKTPTDYNKVKDSSGGSADRKRIFLAYNIAVYNLINYAKAEVIAPMIIDTPNQQEQAESNYESILKYFYNDIPEDAQLFICAMPNNLLEEYEQNANVIKLDGNKLLSCKNFDEHNCIVDEFIELFDNNI